MLINLTLLIPLIQNLASRHLNPPIYDFRIIYYAGKVSFKKTLEKKYEIDLIEKLTMLLINS
jgi:hypothetical protein